MQRRFTLAATVVLMLTPAVHGQWPPSVSRKAPRRADGKVDLAAPAPRTALNKPDLSGVWEQYGEGDMPKFLINLAADLKPDGAPLQPALATSTPTVWSGSPMSTTSPLGSRW